MNKSPNNSRSVTRREAITTASTLLAAICTAPAALAIKPIVRTSVAPLKLSLAAYSMRKYLPNTRNDPNAKGEMDIFGFIDYAASLDIDAVELTSYFMPQPLSTETINEIKRKSHLHGLGISGGAIGNNFTYDPKSKEAESQMAYTRLWIDHYAAMSVPVIRVFGGQPAKGVSESRGVKNIISNMSSACEYAGEKGVILAMENHDFLTDIDRMIPVIEKIDSPWFGVNFDSGNIALTDDPYRELARIAPYAVNAQIKASIPVLGHATKLPTDLDRVITILQDADYRGYITLEYEDAEDPYTAIPKYLSELRELI